MGLFTQLEVGQQENVLILIPRGFQPCFLRQSSRFRKCTNPETSWCIPSMTLRAMDSMGTFSMDGKMELLIVLLSIAEPTLMDFPRNVEPLPRNTLLTVLGRMIFIMIRNNFVGSLISCRPGMDLGFVINKLIYLLKF